MPAGSQTTPVIEAQELVPVPFTKFCGYFLWLGTTGFGGPMSTIGYMDGFVQVT